MLHDASLYLIAVFLLLFVFYFSDVNRVHRRFRDLNPELIPKTMSIEASRDVRLSKSLICTLPELKVRLFFFVHFFCCESQNSQGEKTACMYTCVTRLVLILIERRVYSALPQCRFWVRLSDKSVARPFTHRVNIDFVASCL